MKRKCKCKNKKKHCVFGKLLITGAAGFAGYWLYKSKKK